MPRFSPKTAPYSLPPASFSPDPVRARDLWTERGTGALVVGDVVLVTDMVEVQLRVDDRVATRWGGRKTPEKVSHEGMAVKRRCLRTTLATVVDAAQVRVGRSVDTHRTLKLCVQWSGAEVATEAYPVGRKVDLGQGAVGRNRLKRVERLVGSGPRVRTDEAGREMLLDRLLRSCGPDPVADLARLVDPRATQAGDPVTLGTELAKMVLDRSAPVRTWMLAQIEGRMPIPDAEDTDAQAALDHERFGQDSDEDEWLRD